MKILHYMHDLWGRGGVATYLRLVTGQQVALGHEVLFADSSPVPAGAAIHHVATGADLAALAKSVGADVIHTHIGPPGGLRTPIPVVRTVHGHQHYCPSGSQFLARRGVACERMENVFGCTWGHLIDDCGSRKPSVIIDAFRRTRDERATGEIALIAISEFVRGRLLRAGYPDNRIVVLPNPAPVAEPVVPISGSSPAEFVFMGRIVEPKGPSWLLEAFVAVATPSVLHFAGVGPELARLRERATRSGLSGRVQFHGWMAEGDVRALVDRSRAVVVPSLWHEPAGLAAIEASSRGRPVIASAVGGLPEMVRDGVTGFCVPRGDTAALAGALEKLAGDPALAGRLGEEGRRRARRVFSLVDHVDRVMEIYTVGQLA